MKQDEIQYCRDLIESLRTIEKTTKTILEIMQPMLQTCEGCDRKFLRVHESQRFCSPKCRAKIGMRKLRIKTTKEKIK